MIGYIFFFAALILVYGFGMKKIFDYMKAKETHMPYKKACPPHEWQELETAPGSGLVYLKCKDCRQTLSDILGN